jgi:hypothetical protein
MSNETMDRILDALDHGRQRATYGAVAAVVGESPRVLMKGRSRDTRHSWVVSKTTGLPTGYAPVDIHPELLSKPEVLSTREQLSQWLETTGPVASLAER